ncbi:MAG: FKBP-type peptidyl-prolyl cis-trans isomerase [Candidatus Latescibacterota bacterium]|jgi:FKBP-type peptidyl-prolyl cis-trans isomerase
MHSLFASALLPLTALLIGCGDPCAEQVDSAFLAEAAAAPGAVQTPSGLIYQELKAGDGPSPLPTDQVLVRYTGMLTDSTVFDYTATYRSPRKISLEKAIPGWIEGIQKMKGGGKARLTIPPHLAYGKKGKKFDIPGCAILVFEIELLGIESTASAVTKE